MWENESYNKTEGQGDNRIEKGIVSYLVYVLIDCIPETPTLAHFCKASYNGSTPETPACTLFLSVELWKEDGLSMQIILYLSYAKQTRRSLFLFDIFAWLVEFI